jgi:8-oxo-dGTP pyrophosphatase MutT (NUDIX family)
MSEIPPPFVVAVAAVVVRDGRLLALRRSRHKDAGPGLWETLSGRVEADEEPLDAVRREIVEETGLGVEVEVRPLTAYTARRLQAPMVVIVYRARYRSGEVRLSEEHDAFAWLTVDAFAARSNLGKLVAAARLALDPPLPQ